MRATHLKSVQKENRATVLNFIRQAAPVSRQGIARGLGLSPTTVSSAVSYLIEQNFVHETGAGPSSGGRPPVFLEIQPDSGIILGVDMSSALPNRILRAAALNLKGEILHEVERREKIEGNKALKKALQDIWEALFDSAEVRGGKVLALGVSVPGIVNLECGALTAAKIGVKDFQIRKFLEDAFGLPVVIQNSEDVAALGEYYFGAGRDANSIFFLSVGYGVGAGMVVDGKIFTGNGLSTGELGHITILPNGPLCHCGNYGCLSALVSSEKILENMSALLDKDENHHLKELFTIEDELNIHKILEGATQGEKLSVALIEKTAQWLGIAVGNIINLLNPEMIIFDGDLLDKDDFFLGLVREEVKKRVFYAYFERTTLLRSALGRNAGLRGIGILALDTLLASCE